ncbi:unnamed protein product [Adineta steineri]|uniref:DH domain-containing protein n=1 Tax=Adineta steineri TaxID=433720 RepID=A0A814RYA3_9BILA|nr:unnamed protein product [Adineta steineri]CAF3961056.1 unnamed protein product [Adineta steineri]
MNDESILSDDTDDDRTQNDLLSSSISSDDILETSSIEPMQNSLISLLSTEDIEQCLYVLNINWRKKFTIYLSNNQDQQQINSSYSHDNICNYKLNPLNSYWDHSGGSLPSVYFNNNDNNNNILLNSLTTDNRLKPFAERLLELEHKILTGIREKSNEQQTSSTSLNNFQQHRSSLNNIKQTFSNDKKHLYYFALISYPKNNYFSKLKLHRIDTSRQYSLGEINGMSSIEILPTDSRSSSPLFFEPRRHSITTINTSDHNLTIEKCQDKQTKFEIKTNIFNRNIQLKTKQDETIYTNNQSSSNTNKPFAPHKIQVHHPTKSSIVNNSLQSIRVCVSSSPYDKEFIQKIETQSPSYSSILSNIVTDNHPKEQTKSNEIEEETFDRRPLLDLINQLNQRNLSNQAENHSNNLTRTSSTSSNILPPKQNSNNLTRTSSTSSNILPPKHITPFKPVILRKKSQKSIDRFNYLNNIQESSPSSPSYTRRNGVVRSYTIPSPTDVNKNFNQISSQDPIICQSTPQLNSSDPSIESSNSTTIQDNSSLSTSAISLTNTLNPNVTPTSGVTIDDKNEAKRKAIAMQMYDTEKSYVEALKNLVTKYYLPMKDKNIVSNDLINDIFYKIPEIHIHHTAFLISLSQKLSQWNNKQTVGDILLQMFTRTSVIETYTGFVNNYKTAQIAIRLCRDFSSFNKFLEQQARDHRGKLTLRDLIIQPVQRIPRYELYLKDFLKCTNINHPDYQLLLKAQLEIHSLAKQIDQVQKEVGSAEVTLTNNSLEVVQDMIENLTDLVHINRYYICHDVVTVQSSSGLKKDRCIFLFNDLIIITSCKRKYAALAKKTNNSVIVNSPSGKQYIDNAKHKLIMKIPLDTVDLAADHLKKTRSFASTPPTLKKSHSTASATLDKHRHLEEDIFTLGQMSDLAKTITVPHQQLDDSIKETINIVNKCLLDETTTTNTESNSISDNNNNHKSNNVQLILNTTDSIETIDIIFSSSEQKISWEKNFLEAKKILLDIAAGQRNISFQQVLTLPHHRPGSQFSCGTVRPCSNDVCLCNNEGEICLINIESDITVKSFNGITLSDIKCIAYIPSNKIRQKASSIKSTNHERKTSYLTKQPSTNSDDTIPIDSLLDSDTSDDDDISHDDNLSLNTVEEDFINEQQISKDATLWLGTENGELFIYECSQTMKSIARKNGIIKQLNLSIHSILYTDNKVFLALNHGKLCVFKRDLNGCWDFDSPIIRSIEENSRLSSNKTGENYDEENTDPISIMTLAAGKLWCAIRDKIYVVCINSLNVQHSFIVDDCHRHVSCMATSGSSMHHVWIASQGSHEIRLYHATHFVCLFETSIRTAVTQKLQACDDIIRVHKLGCLYVSTLHVCKEILWIGTSAGIIVNLIIPQLIDLLSINGTSKLTLNSIQLKGLTFGHVGPVRFILSTDKNILSTTDDGSTIKTFVITIGDGFEDFNNNDETLGKDDALSHLILWNL